MEASVSVLFETVELAMELLVLVLSVNDEPPMVEVLMSHEPLTVERSMVVVPTRLSAEDEAAVGTNNGKKIPPIVLFVIETAPLVLMIIGPYVTTPEAFPAASSDITWKYQVPFPKSATVDVPVVSTTASGVPVRAPSKTKE